MEIILIGSSRGLCAHLRRCHGEVQDDEGWNAEEIRQTTESKFGKSDIDVPAKNSAEFSQLTQTTMREGLGEVAGRPSQL